MQIKRAFSLLIVCSLLLVTVGIVLASEPGYTRIEYPTVVEPTFDGAWTSSDEWTDGEPTEMSTNVVFRSTFSLLSYDPITVTTNFVVEILDDNTDDAGDYWQIVIDGNLDGGTAPQSDDFRIDVVGHTTTTVYQGDGSGWVEITPAEDDFVFADSISASPTSSTPHWIAEFSILKTQGVVLMAETWGLRLAVYDDSNSAAGVQAWPPTDRDVPNGWGINDYTQDSYSGTPEPEPEPEPELASPVASFTYSPLDPQVNDTITFDSSGCSDTDGTIASYSWDFGDGATSTSQNPTHAYDEEGSYTVSLTVTDNDGLTDTATSTIANVVIPEFSSYLLLFAVLTMLAVVVIRYRKKM